MIVRKDIKSARSNDNGKQTSRPYISIIVPVRNEAGHIRKTLLELVNQRYPSDSYEIIVADGRSTDQTRDQVMKLARRYSTIRLIDNPGKWSSAGRNAAIRESQGDYILLIDGHCEIRNRNYLSDLVAEFEASNAECMGRPQSLEVTNASRLQQAIAIARSCWLGHHPSSHIYSNESRFVPPESVAIAYRRDVFARVGLFDERFDACEDYEFNHRISQAGMRCYLSSKLKVYYQPRNTLKGLFRQMVRYGQGRIRLTRKHPDTLSLACLVPASLLLGLIVGPIIAAMLTMLWIPYITIAVAYLMLVLIVSARLAVRNRSFQLMLLLPEVFATVHAGAGVGVLWELLSGQGRDSDDIDAANACPERIAT